MPRSTSNPQRTGQAGFLLLAVASFVGLVTVALDSPPRWLQVVLVVVILVLVAAGSSLSRRRAGGWRPSETLARPKGRADRRRL